MSQYINFYIKSGEKMCPIGSYSRNSEIFQAMQYVAPYEKLRAMDKDTLNSIFVQISEEIKGSEDSIRECEGRKKEIALFQNSVEEKMESLFEEDRTIKEYKEIIEEKKFALHICQFMVDILEDVSYGDMGFNHKEYLYAGIEAGPDSPITE